MSPDKTTTTSPTLRSFGEETANLKAVGLGQVGCDIITRLAETPLAEMMHFIALNAHPQDCRETLLADTAILVLIADTQTSRFQDLVWLAKAAETAGCCTLALLAEVIPSPTTPVDIQPRLQSLSEVVGSLLYLPHHRLTDVPVQEPTTIHDNFTQAAFHNLQALTGSLYQPSLITVDFSDLRRLLHSGWAVLGIGQAAGKDQLQSAVSDALTGPGFRRIALTQVPELLVVITAGVDMDLVLVEQTISILRRSVRDEKRVVACVPLDPLLSDTYQVTLLGAGVEPGLILASSPIP